MDNKHERLILCCDSDFYSVDLESSKFGDELVAVQLKFPTDENPNECHEICGPYNGLLLIGFWMINECVDYYLVNPSTRETRILPKPPFTVDHQNYLYNYGFGYDSSNDDYKIVYTYNSLTMFDDYKVDQFLEKNCELSLSSVQFWTYKSEVFVSGTLHWLASTGESDFIVALDLADEKFHTVLSPSFLGYNKLTVLGGCLSVFVKLSASHIDVWVLKEYGISDSWTKFRVSYDYFHGSWKPLCSSRIDRVLFNVMAHDKLFLFDRREEKSKKLVVQGHPTDFVAKTYVESLVSPYRQC
ncbi:hypothetical protein Vadar_018260 [Vaccinium darrowii]|uniref:Uncharacterized protein n=1 Tax=Vaccinium darrowii TaxID=229202 RepID=A0ACB7YEN2_9ERIC|nr:hypothetical protein Vadar_018260 [Vaccinium darrowii]